MDYDTLLSMALEDGRQCLVGALVLDGHGRVFVQQRSPSRRLLPGCWDIVGGHVEDGESILGALRREIEEETGWGLRGRPQLARVTDWEAGRERYREFDFLVDVSGDLDGPKLERGKHVEFRWLGAQDLSILDENDGADGGMVRMLVELALRSATPDELVLAHATIFLPLKHVERERARWDPAMAGQIAAHASVVYPSEVAGLDALLHDLARAVKDISPFRLRLGTVSHFGGPERGVFVAVEDVDGGWAAVRERTVGSKVIAEVEPHVTIVHPRTSNLGPAAWSALGDRSFVAERLVDSVSVTAFDGRRWPTVATFPLGS